MTTDPLKAAAQILEDYEGPSRANTRIAAEVIDAWLRASVACPPCQGTGTLKSGHVDLREQCPGPHTQIEIVDPESYVPATHLTPSEIDGYIRYADPDQFIISRPFNGPETQLFVVPLPPGWTVT